MKHFYEKYAQAIQNTIFAAGFIIFIYVFMNYLFPYVAPFVFGLLLSLVLSPMTSFLEKKLKIWRGVVTLFSLILLITLVGGIGSRIVIKIIDEARLLFSGFSVYLNNLSNNYEALKSRYLDVISFTPSEFRNSVDGLIFSMISSLAQSFGSGVSSTTSNLVTSIPNFLISLLITFISAFFFIKDNASISYSLYKSSPKWLNEKYSLIKQGVLDVLAGYIKAQLILMLFTFAICTAGLLLLRNPYALFLGLMISVIDIMPFFGSGLILLPWAAISLLSGRYALGVSLIAIYLAVLLTRQLAQPHVLSRQIGVHPLFTLIAIYLGFKIFGLPGFFLGPASVVIVKVLIQAKPSNVSDI